MAEVIDQKRLVDATMFDTSTLIAASGGRVRPEQAGACRPLYDAILETGKRILVAAPSFSEFLRKSPKSHIPHLRGLEVVPFDRLAAELLGTKFPASVLVRYREQTADRRVPPFDYIKYDAMIVACAVRHKAKDFVSLDDVQRRMASDVGLRVMWPRDYMAPQQSFSGVQ